MSFARFIQCVALIAFLLGTYKHFVLKETGKCAMTYMYQMPQYIPIRLPKSVRLQFPSYNLYVYGEGSYAHSLEKGNYDGIPVLFLPGNSGSYKQVRSLASVSLTKANENRTPFQFNYFAADFNEELSALYGNFLMKQTEFVSICIQKILDLYAGNGPRSPTSVIVVGHSMGGIVARGLFTLPDFHPETVRLIVTQATPHLEPVFRVDFQMDQFYARVDEYWSLRNGNDSSSSSSSSSKMRDVNLVSIGGGPLDLMVRPDLVGLGDFDNEMLSSSNGVSLMSNAIPGVWVGMDHLCIVWCNQLVLATVRTIFKLIDPTTKQLISKVRRRQNIIDRNLVRGHHKARAVEMPDNWAVPLAYEELWTDRSSKRWEYDGREETSALLLTTNVGEDLVIVASHQDLKPWVFGCVPDSGRAICYVSHALSSSCEDMYLPSESGVKKAFYCRNVKETHLVIKLQANPSHNVEVSVESFSTSKSTYEVSWWRSLFAEETFKVLPGSLFARLRFSALSETWQAYNLRVHSSGVKCKHGIVHQKVPWAKVDTFNVLNDVTIVHHVVLYSQRPTSLSKSSLEVRLYLDPSCSYDVAVTYSLSDSLQQVVRVYIYLIPAFICASVLETTSNVGAKHIQTGSLSILLRNLLIVYVTTGVFKWSFRDTIFESHVVGSKHYDRWLSFPILYFLYVVSSALAALLSRFVSLSLIPTRELFRRLLTNTKFCFGLSDRNVFITNVILASLLAITGYLTCGVLSLLATQLISTIKLFYHELKWTKEESAKRVLYSTSYLTCSLVFLINCPTLVIWIVNLRFQPVTEDPTLILSCIMLVSLFGKGNFVDDLYTVAKAESRTTVLLSWIQTLFSILVLMFGLERIYVVSWFLAADYLLLAFWPLVMNRKINVNVTDVDKLK